MIQRMSHVPIFVLDQEEAKDFYVNKLGFELHTDVDMGDGIKWITVNVPGQKELEIILMGTTASPALDEDGCKVIRELLKAGKMGACAFDTEDCQKTYEELKSKGVEFLSEPEDQFYGVEAVFKDNSGNWFSLTQPKAH